MRYKNGRNRGNWRRSCAMAWRVLCCCVTAAALIVFVWRLGQGIERVRQGEITPAHMIQDMDEWLRGKENEAEGNE